jgi:hypothetical protein
LILTPSAIEMAVLKITFQDGCDLVRFEWARCLEQLKTGYL